jgi:mRNA interferase MazF
MKGEIWSYFDYQSGKRRPGVIISDGGTTIADIDVTIAKITSHQPRNEFDVPIEYWQEAGLIKPSVVRCSKIITLNESELLYRVGKLQEPDLKRVLDTVVKYILS